MLLTTYNLWEGVAILSIDELTVVKQLQFVDDDLPSACCWINREL